MRSDEHASAGGGVRAFVAVDLEPAVRTEIAAATEILCGADGDVRWVSAENLHVTLKFLGSVAQGRLGVVRAALERVVAVAAPFELTVKGFGTFPSAARARVIWVGLVGEGLRALARRVDDEIGAQGFPREARPFAPHVTIGRVRSPRGWSRVAAALTPYGDKVFGRSGVTDVVLYRSDLHPQGARYTALDRFGLAGADEVGPSPRH